MIEVARDYEGLRVAAAEFFEEGFMLPEAQRMLANSRVEDEYATLAKMLPERTYATGYYVWISYLFWLERIQEVHPFNDLLAVEAEGLTIVSSCRDRFMNSHPTCPRCGMPNERHALSCRECGQEFKGAN